MEESVYMFPTSLPVNKDLSSSTITDAEIKKKKTDKSPSNKNPHGLSTYVDATKAKSEKSRFKMVDMSELCKSPGSQEVTRQIVTPDSAKINNNLSRWSLNSLLQQQSSDSTNSVTNSSTEKSAFIFPMQDKDSFKESPYVEIDEMNKGARLLSQSKQKNIPLIRVEDAVTSPTFRGSLETIKKDSKSPISSNKQSPANNHDHLIRKQSIIVVKEGVEYDSFISVIEREKVTNPIATPGGKIQPKKTSENSAALETSSALKDVYMDLEGNSKDLENSTAGVFQKDAESGSVSLMGGKITKNILRGNKKEANKNVLPRIMSAVIQPDGSTVSVQLRRPRSSADGANLGLPKPSVRPVSMPFDDPPIPPSSNDATITTQLPFQNRRPLPPTPPDLEEDNVYLKSITNLKVHTPLEKKSSIPKDPPPPPPNLNEIPPPLLPRTSTALIPQVPTRPSKSATSGPTNISPKLLSKTSNTPERNFTPSQVQLNGKKLSQEAGSISVFNSDAAATNNDVSPDNRPNAQNEPNMARKVHPIALMLKKKQRSIEDSSSNFAEQVLKKRKAPGDETKEVTNKAGLNEVMKISTNQQVKQPVNKIEGSGNRLQGHTQNLLVSKKGKTLNPSSISAFKPPSKAPPSPPVIPPVRNKPKKPPLMTKPSTEVLNSKPVPPKPHFLNKQIRKPLVSVTNENSTAENLQTSPASPAPNIPPKPDFKTISTTLFSQNSPVTKDVKSNLTAVRHASPKSRPPPLPGKDYLLTKKFVDKLNNKNKQENSTALLSPPAKRMPVVGGYTLHKLQAKRMVDLSNPPTTISSSPLKEDFSGSDAVFKDSGSSPQNAESGVYFSIDDANKTFLPDEENLQQTDILSSPQNRDINSTSPTKPRSSTLSNLPTDEFASISKKEHFDRNMSFHIPSSPQRNPQRSPKLKIKPRPNVPPPPRPGQSQQQVNNEQKKTNKVPPVRPPPPSNKKIQEAKIRRHFNRSESESSFASSSNNSSPKMLNNRQGLSPLKMISKNHSRSSPDISSIISEEDATYSAIPDISSDSMSTGSDDTGFNDLSAAKQVIKKKKTKLETIATSVSAMRLKLGRNNVRPNDSLTKNSEYSMAEDSFLSRTGRKFNVDNMFTEEGVYAGIDEDVAPNYNENNNIYLMSLPAKKKPFSSELAYAELDHGNDSDNVLS